MSRFASALVDRWSELIWLDYAIPTAVTVSHIAFVGFGHKGDWLSWIDLSQRLAAYSTGATVISIFGGLGAIAITVYLGATGERARMVRVHYHTELRRNWRSLITASAGTALLCLLCQALDRPHDPFSVRFIFEFAVLVAVSKLVRLTWLFDRMVRVADRDLAEAFSPAPTPKLGAGWRNKIPK